MTEYSDNSLKVYERLYFSSGETKPEDVHERVAKFIANNENEYQKFKYLLDNKIFRPNTPTFIASGVGGNNEWDKNLSACFPCGTKITTENGLINIEDIEKNYRILTHTGKIKNVLKKSKRFFSGSLININAKGILKNTVKCTPEHPFLMVKKEDIHCVRDKTILCNENTKGNFKRCFKQKDQYKVDCNKEINFNPSWTEAKDLKVGDYLLISSNKDVDNTSNIKIIDYLDSNYRVEGDYIVSSKNYNINKFKNEIDVNENLMRFFGYYLAEGSADEKGDIRVTFSIKENEIEYCNEVKLLFKSIFDVNANIQECQQSGTRLVRFHSAPLSMFLIKLFGKYQTERKIPDWIMKLDPSLQKQLIIGIFRGDGCKQDKNQHFNICLANFDLVYQIWNILLRMDIFFSFGNGYISKKLQEKLKKWNDIFLLNCPYHSCPDLVKEIWPDAKIEERKSKNSRTIFKINDFFAVPISDIQTEEFNGDVFNFEVEDDNSYCVFNVCVHNCFVIGMDDSMESIIDVWSTCSKIYAGGAGCGIPITNLREEGSPIGKNKGVASGPLKYLHVIESVANTVKSGGRHRRASNLASAKYNHPDIFKIIEAKLNEDNLKSFNISILVDDFFMDSVYRGFPFDVDLISPNGNIKIKTVNGMDIWNKIVETAYKSGDPGLLFYDTANRVHPFPDEKVVSSNPCVTGDTLIYTSNGQIPIKELVGQKIEIYNGFMWSNVMPYKTAENQKLMKISFKSIVGNINYPKLRCTEYHNFILEDGTRIPANKLSVGDNTLIWKDEYGICHQHKVIAIEELDEREDVFCFTEWIYHSGIFEGVIAAQCGEILLPPWSICNLGSINLTKCIHKYSSMSDFDYDLLRKYSEIATRFLDNVIDKTGFVHEKFKERALSERPIGLGLMGFSDVLFELKIPYNSELARNLFRDICKIITTTAFETSIELAKEKGPIVINDQEHFESLLRQYTGNEEIVNKFKEYGIRNSSVSSIAPTGSISLSCDCSYSFEPCFALVWTKELAESHELMYFVNPIFEEWLDNKSNLDKNKVLNDIVKNNGSIQNLEYIPKSIRDVFVTAHDVDYESKLLMQSEGQKYITLGISSTCNLPNSATIDDIGNIYTKAWKYGLKGITVYRDGCKSWQPVNFSCKEEVKKENEKYERPIVRSGKTIEIKSPDGGLYVTINKDDTTNKIIEVFLRMGKQGNKINLLIDALSRCISKGLQSGMNLKEFATTLRGNKDDSPFYFRLDELQEKPYQAESIVDAIGIILDSFSEDNPKIKLQDDKGNLYEMCPSCNQYTLSRSLGCRNGQCIDPKCGYSSCS